MAGVCVHEGFRCDSCMAGQCYDGPTYHTWITQDDINAYVSTDTALPTGAYAECGCYFCGRPAIARQKSVSNNQQGT
jgi:hypothetical protein